MKYLNWTDYVSLLMDITVPFAIIGDIAIYVTFGQKSKLCPIFLGSMRNMFLINIEIYLVELLLKEPANFGFFWDFWMQNGWWIGKYVFANSSVWHTVVLAFALEIAVSRFWCVWSPVTYQLYWNTRVTTIISLFIWGAGCLLTLHVFFFVNCRAYPKTNTSLTFNTVTPNIVHTLLNTYVKSILPFLICCCYAGMGIVLWRMNRDNHLTQINLWNKTTKKIVVSQVVILIPKVMHSCCAIYSNLEAFVPQFRLIPLNLDFYYLVIKFGAVGYGVLATVVILICFPLTWQTMKEMFLYRFLPKSWRSGEEVSKSGKEVSKISLQNTNTWTTHLSSKNSSTHQMSEINYGDQQLSKISPRN